MISTVARLLRSTTLAATVATCAVVAGSAIGASAGTDDDSLLKARVGMDPSAVELDARPGTDDDSLLKIRLLIVDDTTGRWTTQDGGFVGGFVDGIAVVKRD